MCAPAAGTTVMCMGAREVYVCVCACGVHVCVCVCVCVSCVYVFCTYVCVRA